MEKVNIDVNPNLCIACYSCQLWCSLVYTGAFNPEKARITIVYSSPPHISFSDDCIKGCSLCTKYCPTGAIKRANRRS
jgi:NAD-dependent dihydropyrimidine dehydrogenase PreA subunit